MGRQKSNGTGAAGTPAVVVDKDKLKADFAEAKMRLDTRRKELEAEVENLLADEQTAYDKAEAALVAWLGAQPGKVATQIGEATYYVAKVDNKPVLRQQRATVVV